MFHEADEDVDKPWIEELDTDEFGDASSDVVPCPSCSSLVHENAEACPSCGHFIVHRSSAWHGKPSWWVVLGLAGVTAVLWLLMP